MEDRRLMLEKFFDAVKNYKNQEIIFDDIVTQLPTRFDLLSNTRHFVLTCIKKEINSYMALPFNTCSFEIINGDFDSFNLRGISLKLHSVLFHEISPEQVLFFGLVSKINRPDLKTGTVEYLFNPKNECSFATNVLGRVIATLCEYNNATRSVNIKRNSGFNKKQARISTIIYCGKRYELENLSKTTGIKLDYSHRFEVRGHWRKVKFIGKDREGNYNQNGYTWVVPHEKGEGELIKKTRVFTSSQSEHSP